MLEEGRESEGVGEGGRRGRGWEYMVEIGNGQYRGIELDGLFSVIHGFHFKYIWLFSSKSTNGISKHYPKLNFRSHRTGRVPTHLDKHGRPPTAPDCHLQGSLQVLGKELQKRPITTLILALDLRVLQIRPSSHPSMNLIPEYLNVFLSLQISLKFLHIVRGLVSRC